MRTSRITVFVGIAALATAGLGLASFAAPEAAQRRRASPHEKTEATVDGAKLTITYGRPYMRGRTIFGALVPYDRVWCPGADEVTTITSSKAMRLGDLQLKAGEYAMWMLPTAGDWTLIINSDAGAFHTYHNTRTDLGRVRMQKRALAQPVEQLTFAIAANPSGGGVVRMSWEKTEVSTPLTIAP